MLDVSSLEVTPAVGGLDVVIQQFVVVAGDLVIILIGNAGRHDEEVDFRCIEDVAGEGAAVTLIHGIAVPRSDRGPAGIGLVVVVADQVEAVEVAAHLEHHGGHRGDIEGKRPDGKVGGGDPVPVTVGGSIIGGARIVGIALGNEDGGRGGVFGWVGVQDILRIPDRLVAGEGLFDLHVDGRAIVHVAAVERGEEIMPGLLRIIGAVVRAVMLDRFLYFPVIEGPVQTLDLLGSAGVVLARHDDGPVAEVLGPAVLDVGIGGGIIVIIGGRGAVALRVPEPVPELGMAPVIRRIEPRPILDMHDVIGGRCRLIEESLDGGGPVAGPGGGAGKIRDSLLIITVAATPGVVAIM